MDSTNWQNIWSGGLTSLFNRGNKNPANAAMGFFNEIPGQLKENFNPWINYGQQLTQDPGGRLNQIGQGYLQSPGFKFALQQALQGGNHAAAAGGMAGSPAHEQQNMELATNLANQDYNNWMQNALGLHNLGFGVGSEGGMRLGEDLATALQNKGKLSYEGQNAQNQSNQGMWSSLFGAGASLIPFLL